MSELPNVAELTALASFLAPGFVLLGIRNRFKEGSTPNLASNVALYAVASSAYYAAISPLFHVPWGISIWPWLWSLLQFFLIPLFLSALLVIIDQNEWFYKLCAKMNIDVAHHVPTAWDWTFKQRRQPSYVVVHLKDGTIYRGTWTEKSFASSSSTERDIYLEQSWGVDGDGNWMRLDPARSILICSKEVSAIEIIGSGS